MTTTPDENTSNISDAAVRREPMGKRRTRVLIVDDEPAIREVLEMMLQSWGYDVRLASDGAEAKQLVESYDPEVVISDVVMPQLSGLDLLRTLKAGNTSRPVILVTAHASVDLAVESMKQGAQDFITKPMDYPKLHTILKAAESDIQTRQTSRKLTSQLERGSGFGEFVRIDDTPMQLYAMPLHRNGQAVGTLLVVHETSYIDTLAMHTLRDSLLSALVQMLFITVLAIILVRLTLTGPLTRIAKWLRGLRTG